MKMLPTTPHLPSPLPGRDALVRPHEGLSNRPAPEARPTRIPRAADEEALFAYNRQAGTETGRPKPTIDLYV